MEGATSDAVPASVTPDRGRCVTGIEGLDAILGGGIPKGNVVLVAGTVGTGKTTLSLEFLVRGAERGERSIFLSMTESSSKLVQNLASFEFFQRKLLDDGSLVLIDVPAIYDRLGLSRDEMSAEEVDLLVRAIRDLIVELGAKRIVLDSLTSVSYRIRKEERIRDFILRLGQALNELECTGLLVSEIGPTPGRYSLFGVEEAIVDGVILIGNTRRQGDLLRIVQVIKMRGTPHSRAQYVIELTPIGLLMAPHLKGGRPEGA